MAEAMVKSGSVGSALRVLKTTGRRPDFVRFVNTMASLQGPENKLGSLHLSSLGVSGAAALAACLPKYIFLAELNARVADLGEKEKYAFVMTLKGNGSLLKVKIEPALDNQSQEYVEAICQRNEQMPLLLGRPTGDGGAEGIPPDEAVEAETVARYHAASAATTTTTRLKLFPSLFAAALETPRMTPHMMLMGLGPSTEDIGFDKPTTVGKRTRQH